MISGLTRNAAGSLGAVAALALLVGGVCEAADRGLNIVIPKGPDGAAHGLQVSPEPWCPGDQLPFGIQANGSPGDRVVGTALAISNLEYVPPCTVTVGTGTCTVQDATTLTWDIVADASGVARLETQITIPVAAPASGQICLAITNTVTPAGGSPEQPDTATICIAYSCPRIPALDPKGRLLLALALAFAAALALARRSG